MKAKYSKHSAIAVKGFLLSLCIAFSSPSIAFADEKEGIAFLIPDMNEFIPMLVVFIIVFVLLSKFAWPLVDGIITKRAETVRAALKKSEESKVEAEEILNQRKEELRNAKAEAAQIVSDARRSGEMVKAELNAQAEKESASLIKKAKHAIQSERKTAALALQESVVDISIDVCERFVGENLSDGQHRKIIERYVNEAGSLNGN